MIVLCFVWGPDNGALYSRLGLPFVMGTTGGDRERLTEDARQSGVYALIAPNMGKQVGQSQVHIAVTICPVLETTLMHLIIPVSVETLTYVAM